MVLVRCLVTERLMRSVGVVPLDPSGDRRTRVLDRLEGVLPDTLLVNCALCNVVARSEFREGAGCPTLLIEVIGRVAIPHDRSHRFEQISIDLQHGA